MKFKLLLLVFAFITGLTLNAQDKEWFGSLPGDPSGNASFYTNSNSHQTQNYLCWQRHTEYNTLHLFDGQQWSKLICDSIKGSIFSMDNQNDSFIVLSYNPFNNGVLTYFYAGSQWKRINKLTGFNYNAISGISDLKFFKNKIYGVNIISKGVSSLVEYDLKTNQLKTVVTFQQKPANDVYNNPDKLRLLVNKQRLYVSGAFDSVNHVAAQGYGYYDGTSFKALNIFPVGSINYTIVKPLDNNQVVAQRYFIVTGNDISS